MPRNKEFDPIEKTDLALKLFWKQGYEKTSMNDLVEAMGLHRGSIYDTYGDKKQLFESCLQRYKEQICRKLQLTLFADTDLKSKFRKIIAMLLQGQSQNGLKGCFMVNTAAELEIHDERIQQLVKDNMLELQQAFYQCLVRAYEKGELASSESLAAKASMLANTLIGLQVMSKTGVPNRMLEEIVETTLMSIH